MCILLLYATAVYIISLAVLLKLFPSEPFYSSIFSYFTPFGANLSFCCFIFYFVAGAFMYQCDFGVSHVKKGETDTHTQTNKQTFIQIVVDVVAICSLYYANGQN